MDIIHLITKEALRRGYSRKTIETYVYAVKLFFKKCKKEPRMITKSDIKSYIDILVDKGASGSTINVHLNAIRFLMIEILHRKMYLNWKYSKIPKTLPTVLTKEEVKRLVNIIKNPKHKLAIQLLYSSGLRLSELVHLRSEDLELDNNLGWVRKGKGSKDRLFIIAKRLKEELKQYVEKNCPNPKSWVFTGSKGRHLSQRTVQDMLKRIAKEAGISKNIHPHTLRHSFATHLIEDGYDISSVQFLLGHNSVQTTMKYVHMSSPKMISVKSPYDNI